MLIKGDTCCLLCWGANDPRVPSYESEQIADAVRKNGNEVWFLKLGDEGHGIRKKGNRDYEEGVVAMFLKKYLLNDSFFTIILLQHLIASVHPEKWHMFYWI